VTLKSIGVEVTEDDDPANFQRPQDKFIKFLLKKLDLKTNLYGGGPSNVQDQIILDIENAKNNRD
jgi:UDP-N-acetylglucosamine enolpyruvyl transferase